MDWAIRVGHLEMEQWLHSVQHAPNLGINLLEDWESSYNVYCLFTVVPNTLLTYVSAMN
jgi:hypothetical protein